MEKLIVSKQTGKILRDIRAYQKRTLNESAVATKVDRNTLDNIELGKVTPRRKTLEKIAAAYGLNVFQLTGQQPIVWATL